MILESRAVQPFEKNGFVLGCEDTREGVVIDPGDDVELLLEAVRHHGLSIRYILLTHAHLDHITGVGRAKEALGAPIVLHRDDNFLYVLQEEPPEALRPKMEEAVRMCPTGAISIEG